MISILSNVVIGFEQSESLQIMESIGVEPVIVTTIVPINLYPFQMQTGSFSVTIEVNEAHSTAALGIPHQQ